MTSELAQHTHRNSCGTQSGQQCASATMAGSTFQATFSVDAHDQGAHGVLGKAVALLRLEQVGTIASQASLAFVTLPSWWLYP